jgi:magnesium transporter
MLRVNTCQGPQDDIKLDPSSRRLPPGPLWIDILNPTEDEIAFVQDATGIVVPSREQLSEVESTSRLRTIAGDLYLSLPIAFRNGGGGANLAPVGLILSADRLVTVRFDELKSFEAFRDRVNRGELARPSTVGIFVALLEAIVDRLADILEEVGADLDALADRIFAAERESAMSGNKKISNARLRITVKKVGAKRQLISKVRATLLGIGRIVPYVEGEGSDWLPPDAKPRLDMVKADIVSLDEFEVHLSDKVAFLLDAALGLINIEQNDTFRILTIASVVGIPPTLVASMYGMNFKNMPELNWTYGYAWGLFLIVASAIIPLVYFRVKGWF